MGKPTSINIRGLRGEERAKELQGLDLNRVLVVAIDTARDHPKALICNYFGKVLEKPFFFTVNFNGITMLHHKIQEHVGCVKAKRLYVGVEVAGHYHNDIVDSLTKLGYQVDIINGSATASQRTKMLDYSKTDNKDLVALAQLIIENSGLNSKRVTGIYKQLQLVCRSRREYVRNQSAIKNQIRRIMTSIFREFQGLIEPGTTEKLKIFGSFWNEKSRFIMRNCPCPQQILKLGQKQLVQKATAANIKLTHNELKLLFKAADRALIHNNEHQNFLSHQLRFKLDQLQMLEKQIAELKSEMERLLVQTPGVLLLTIKGLSIITTAEFIGEVGSIHNYTYNRPLIKLAGINPILSQSGGKEVSGYQISRQGNSHLRYIVVMIGQNLCSNRSRNTYFLNYYERLKDKGKTPLQIYNAAANKFLRIAFAMLRDLTVFYIPGFEECSSNIASKIAYKANRETAVALMNKLTAKTSNKYQAV